MTKWLFRSIQKLQALFILVLGVCIILFYMTHSNEVSHKKILTGFTELKELLGQDINLTSEFKTKFINKCKGAVLNKDKLNASEQKICDYILLKYNNSQTLKKPLQ